MSSRSGRWQLIVRSTACRRFMESGTPSNRSASSSRAASHASLEAIRWAVCHFTQMNGGRCHIHRTTARHSNLARRSASRGRDRRRDNLRQQTGRRSRQEEADRLMLDAVKNYLNLASGVTEVTRQRAIAAAKALASSGEATAEQVSNLADELIVQSRNNRDALLALVRYEVDRALNRLGLATADEVASLQRRVTSLEGALALSPSEGAAKATGSAKATKAPGKPPAKAAPAKSTAAKSTAAKATA